MKYESCARILTRFQPTTVKGGWPERLSYFIKSSAPAVAWDASISPCLPLRYIHMHYIKGYWRMSHAHIKLTYSPRCLHP